MDRLCLLTAFLMFNLFSIAVDARCFAQSSGSVSANSQSAMSSGFATTFSEVKADVGSLSGQCQEVNVRSIAESYVDAIATAFAEVDAQVFAIVEADENCNAQATTVAYGEARGVAKAIAAAYTVAIARTFGWDKFAFAQDQAVATDIQEAIAEVDCEATTAGGVSFLTCYALAEVTAQAVAYALSEAIVSFYGCTPCAQC